MRDFEAKKREILDRIDIVDVVSEQVALRRSGQRWVGLCPFHSEKTASFTVRPEHGLFKCFGCGKGGDVFSFVQFRENVPFIEAMRILADRAGVQLEGSTDRSPSGADRADIARVNAWAARFFRSQLLDPAIGQSARAYLSDRSVTDATAEMFQLGLATDGPSRLQEAASRAGISISLLFSADLIRRSEQGHHYDTFRKRLMFPIHDATRRVIGFGGRTLGDDRAKYLNTRQNVLFDKGRALYGIEFAREAASSARRVVVVEGYTDCVAAHQAGFRETVATLGTALTEAHVALLRRYFDRIVLLFDSDEAGAAAADRAIRTAVPRCVTVELARIPEGKDPSEFLERAGAAEFSDVLNGAVDALEFKWHQTRERFEGDAPGTQRREAVLDFLRVVAEAAETNAVDAIQRGLLVNQVAHLLRMDRAEVAALMARFRSRQGMGDRARPGAPAVPPGAVTGGEQAAWSRVLEVVLNEPEALAGIEDVPDPGLIADPCERRITTTVFNLWEARGTFRMADVLAQCHDPADAERVAELARRGEGLTDYAKTLRTSFDRIRRASDDRDLEERKKRLLQEETPSCASGEALGDRERVSDGVRRHAHFAPRRLIRRSAVTDTEADQTAKSKNTE